MLFLFIHIPPFSITSNELLTRTEKLASYSRMGRRPSSNIRPRFLLS